VEPETFTDLRRRELEMSERAGRLDSVIFPPSVKVENLMVLLGYGKY
jgi:hypothetical protein